MDMVQKSSDSESYTTSSEPFGFYLSEIFRDFLQYIHENASIALIIRSSHLHPPLQR
jgi:hypothetical protein